MKSALALGLLLAAAPVMADPADIDLAQRVVADIGGFGPLIRAGANTPPPGLFAPLYARAYRQEIAAHPEWVAQADKSYAGLLADQLDHQQLQAMADHWETPVGRGIAAKRSAATEDGRIAQLTPEEQTAEDTFFNSADGKAINARLEAAQMRTVLTLGPVFQTIKLAALKRYCADGGDCSNIKFPDPQHF